MQTHRPHVATILAYLLCLGPGYFWLTRESQDDTTSSTFARLYRQGEYRDPLNDDPCREAVVKASGLLLPNALRPNYVSGDIEGGTAGFPERSPGGLCSVSLEN